MISVCDRDEVVRNVYRIAKSHNRNKCIDTPEELREGYLAFLAARQPSVPINHTDDFFVEDLATQDKLSQAFAKGALNDLSQEDVVGQAYETSELEEKIQVARNGLLKLLQMEDDFAFIFDLVVHSIFVRPSKPAKVAHGSHGGSSSASIGSIWLAMSSGIKQIDVIEMLVHELTHHLVFIDELNHPQFNYELITLKQNFALSAILKRQRPLDKVIHSIVVGAALVLARKQFIGNHEKTLIHPPTLRLQADTLAAIDSVLSLSNVNDLITRHMREVILECANICHAPEMDI